MNNYDQMGAHIILNTGDSVDWNNVTQIIPDGMVILALDTNVFKIGNGVNMYSDLPDDITILNYDHITELDVVTDETIIITSNSEYVASSQTLSQLLSSIGVVLDGANDNTANLDHIDTKLALVDMISTTLDIEFSILVDGNMSLSGTTLSSLPIIETTGGSLHIRDIGIYTDSEFINRVEDHILVVNEITYIHIDGTHDDVDPSLITYDMTSGNAGVHITQIHEGYHQITIDSNLIDTLIHVDYSVTYDGKSISKTLAIVAIVTQDILTSTYGGAVIDYFNGVATDTNGNIICAGYVGSEGAGGNDTSVVKFDTNLNILAKKVYGGSGHDIFYGVTTDTNNDIICVGNTASEGAGSYDTLVVKFDPNLNILAKTIYGGFSYELFYAVTIDSSDNIICVGYTHSEGSGHSSALLVKFDTNLSILARKVYGGAGSDRFHGIATDINNNIICAGWTNSEGAGGIDTSVVKFDTDFNILASKVYGGSGDDRFFGVATDSNGNVICAGWTSSEGAGGWDALVVKFDTNLNILAKKVYSGTGIDWFWRVATDTNGNIICVGFTTSEGAGSDDALVVKFDSNLNILAKKIYGGAGTDWLFGVAIDTNGNVICAGRTSSEGAGSADTLVVKLPSDIPTGTFTGTLFTNLTLGDSNLTLADSNLTLADSNLTFTDSNLTLADSNLTFADSNLTQELDKIEL